MARPVTNAEAQKPVTGPVTCGFGTRHFLFMITRTVRASTSTAIPMRRAWGLSALRAYTPTGAPKKPAIATGPSSR